MPDLHETANLTINGNNVVYPTYPIIAETEQQKKRRVVSSIIEQVGELEQQAQISVLRSVAAFFSLEGELG